jgi:hypothetical protein
VLRTEGVDDSSSASVSSDDNKKGKEKENKELRVTLDVGGMRCMKNCGTPVQNVLRGADLSDLGASWSVWGGWVRNC